MSAGLIADNPLTASAQQELQERESKTATTAEWLSFKLSGLDYAVAILKVREIRIWEVSTRIPYAPDYVTGLINLRGAIVPIVDLRRRLGLAAKQQDLETVILIVDVASAAGNKTVGIVVDAIAEVLTTDSDNSQLLPEFDLAIPKIFVAGITDYDNSMVILLNVDTLLDIEV